MSIHICSRDTKPCIICFFLQLPFSWHEVFHLLAWFWGPWHATEAVDFQFSHFEVANRKYHASFRCTNWLGDVRCTAAFPVEDNELLREDFSYQVGTSLLWDFLCFSVQKELSNCLKSESVIWIKYLHFFVSISLVGNALRFHKQGI